MSYEEPKMNIASLISEEGITLGELASAAVIEYNDEDPKTSQPINL